MHPQLGNNAQLVAELELGNQEPFFPWKGIELGIRGTTSLDRARLVEKIETVVGGKVHLCPGGPDNPENVGVITGGAGGEIYSLAGMGIDTFVTGEGPHWSYTAAEEMGLNLIYAGHYATETFGVKALSAKLAETFGIGWEFLDHPTGL